MVNIPEDAQRVGEPDEGELSVMTGGPLGPLYGAATMVGPDERNGRFNPALETDDDLEAQELEQLRRRGPGGGGVGGGGGGIGIGATGVPPAGAAVTASSARGDTAF